MAINPIFLALVTSAAFFGTPVLLTVLLPIFTEVKSCPVGSEILGILIIDIGPVIVISDSVLCV